MKGMRPLWAALLVLCCGCGERELVVWVSAEDQDEFIENCVVRVFEDGKPPRSIAEFPSFEPHRSALVMPLRRSVGGTLTIECKGYKPQILTFPSVGTVKHQFVLERVRPNENQ